MKILRAIIPIVAVLFLCLTGAAHAAPVGVSDDLPPTEATAQEIKLRERVAAEVEKHWTVLVNPVYNARVETIVNRLSPQMERRLNYDVDIIDEKSVNAFALAGGKMYVTTGMLDFVKSDVELAGVIAHEMVHADKKHVIIQTARNNRMTLLALAAAIASKGKGAALVASNLIHVAIMGAYSIELEKEADALGIDALSRAGYNAVGVLTIQERLKEERMKHPEIDPGIYRTHPEVEERIAAAEKYLGDHDIPVHRKYALANLRAAVEETSPDGRLALTIDGETIWRGGDDSATKEVFGRVASNLNEHLQMETMPFDIRVEGASSDPDAAFYIETKKILSNKEVPKDGEPLAALRDEVQKALTNARKDHPMANYFK
ncbi:MAG: M48 family metalloprotease [Synergistaceae bacterium]|jgi:Zn-dependent protease with chaperone function|nr:M48 family metalloprotease [Synergistaceae bacterium]